MIKKTLLLAVFILPFTLFAQDYLWSLRGGCNNLMGTSGSWNKVLNVTSDIEGNTYMLAQSGSAVMHLDDVPLVGYAEVNNQTNNNQFNLVLASYTPEGENRWTKVIGGRYNTFGYSLQTDNLGHLYLSGRIYPLQLNNDNTPVHFDTDTILPQGFEMNEHKRIMYLAQYDTDGQFNWLHMPEPDTVSLAGPWMNNSWPYKTDVNPENGDVYWHCMLREGQFDWEGDNVITEESDYILKYNSDGEVTGRVKLDMLSAGGNTVGGDCLMYMERDHETGIFYIAGTQISTYEPLTIGGELVSDRLFAAAFSPTGELLWRIEGDNDEALVGVFANNTFYDMKLEDEYLYLTGTLASGSEFNGHNFDLDEETACSPFIMKLDLNGTTQWGHISATEYNSYSKTLAIRGDEVSIGGRSGPISWPGANSTEALTTWSSNSQISRFDKNSGDLIGLDSLIGNNWQTDIQVIHASGDCNYYIGGSFKYQLPLGQDTLEHTGASEQSYFYTRYSYGTDLFFTYSPSGALGSYEFTSDSDAETITWNFGDGSPTQTGGSVSHTFAQEGEYEVCATTSGDCESEFCVTVFFGSTGINELTDNLKIYPNPAVGEIRVDGLDQTTRYSLFSSNGALVGQGSVSSNGSIDISGLSGGIYVLMLQMEDGGFGRMKVAVEGR